MLDLERALHNKLPRGWRWAKLGEVAEYVNGRAFKPEDWKESGLPIIRIQNLTSENSSFNYFNREIEERYRIADGDLLISWSASLDAFIWNRGPAVLNQHIFKVNEYKDRILKKYLFYAVREAMDEIRSQVHGATMKHITKPEFLAIRIPLPPMEEQLRIVSILDEKMPSIERTQKAAASQVEAAKALTAAYLRSVFESPEAQKWPKRRIGIIAETCSGATPPRDRDDYYKGNIPWVKTGELRDNIIDDTEEHVNDLALNETSIKLLPAGTLLIAMYGQGQTRGRTGIILQPATTNQACFAIIPNPKIDTRFIQYWFRHNYNRLRQETEGRGGNQPNLNGDLLRNQDIHFPALLEQKRVVNMLDEMLTLVNTLKDSILGQFNHINKLPAALLRRAFRGEF